MPIKKSAIDVLKHIKESNYEKIKIAIVDIDGILRGKYIDKEKFIHSINSTLGFCSVSLGWDMADQAYNNCKITGWHTGYPDYKIKIDLSSFRTIPWENNQPFFLGSFVQDNELPMEVCPRQLVKKIANEAKAMGYEAMASQEFEWFNFTETPQTAKGKEYKNLTPLSHGMFGYSILRTTLNQPFFHDLFHQLSLFDVPLEGLHTETGPGVLEAAICYNQLETIADYSVLFKTAVKEIGYKHGIMPTFMAKISPSLPGCSGHIHQSLWSIKNKKNIFYQENASDKMSPIMKQYIAGQLYCLPHILPMFAPTINSYKRLVIGAWAPTTLTWGIDNRTTTLRALPLGEKSTRLETRVVGSDANPYLALSACIASGLYGIKHQLTLQPPTIENGYTDIQYGHLPSNLWIATQNMKNSKVAKELLGEAFVDHFCMTREWEWQQHNTAVTDWELQRYFEII